MENIAVLNAPESNISEKVRTNFRSDHLSSKVNVANPVIDNLITEGGENFYNYISWLGLVKDPNLVVLSSQHHYFYSAEEMKNVRTIINLRELNQIKQIKSFLHSSFYVLPQKSNFIGCFVDNEKINGYSLRNNSSVNHNKRNFDAIENGIYSKIPLLNKLYGILDSKTNNYMSKSSVTILLLAYGFQVLNMTELDGLTYFHSQKVRSDFN